MKVILINGSPHAKGRCIKEDIVNSTADKLAQADGMIFASPVYFASINSTFSAFPDCLYASAAEGLNERNAIFR